MLTTRSQDRRRGITRISGGGPPSVGYVVLLAVLVLAALVWDILPDVRTGQWVARVPNDLVMLGGLGSLTVMMWRARHRPE
jgi:hypothetical protein